MLIVPILGTLLPRAVIDIENSNFDSAITKSRTLLEETFCYVIELKGKCQQQVGVLVTYILR